MASVNKDLVTIRDAVLDDRNFILATWLKGLRYGNEWFETIDADPYYKVYSKVIENLLDRPDISVKISCLTEDPSVILGYAVYNHDALRWVHVKAAWRNIGIAKSLVPSDIRVVTHLTKVGLAIFKKYRKAKFNPFFE